jgi:hypothetical protein
MNRRVALATVAVGAALLGGAAIDVDTAPLAGADTGTDLDPLAQLYGDTGFNSWTTAADTDLAAVSPTLTADFTTSVDSFDFDNVQPDLSPVSDPISLGLYSVDPSAFSADPALGGLPDNGIGDLAVGLDYGLFSAEGDLEQVFGPLITLIAEWIFNDIPVG